VTAAPSRAESRSAAPDRYPPVADYALISDCQSAALVSRDGSIDWCCFQRFDARPVFARQLDWDRGGYFRVAPTDAYTVARRYLPSTNVLETRFTTATGAVLVLTDCLARDHDDEHSESQLLRLLRCEHGPVRVAVEFRPRFDYGRTIPRLAMRDDRNGVVYGGADGLVLQADLPMTQVELCGCRSEVDLDTGAERFIAITCPPPHRLHADRLSGDAARAIVAATCTFWTDWSARGTYEGPYREQVLRSALVLKALTHEPTGAIVAAPTTSLPETPGGTRNWDYRYCWLRDAALDLYALSALGYSDEAHAFMEFIERTTAGRASDLQIMYGVGGERYLPEHDIDTLDGYRGSRPVRVGNAAAEQFQLDVYGYLLDTAWLYHRAGGDISASFWDLLRGAVDVVAEQWTRPDEGIWEVRGGPRHFVSSKIMAWVAVDRAIRLARARNLPGDVDAWCDLRHTIRDAIETRGVHPATGAFVQSFGSTAPDASNLLAALVRFLPPDDARVRATIDATIAHLAPDGFVYRYLDRDPIGVDGLPGREATFAICSFWLVDNLALAGETVAAHELFERMLACCNDVGLLAEEIDAGSGELRGNFPQAFSHVGLIGAAINLQRAERRQVRANTKL
jgi:GH15 family glucan-1,4-alpha-glucosidase